MCLAHCEGCVLQLFGVFLYPFCKCSFMLVDRNHYFLHKYSFYISEAVAFQNPHLIFSLFSDLNTTLNSYRIENFYFLRFSYNIYDFKKHFLIYLEQKDTSAAFILQGIDFLVRQYLTRNWVEGTYEQVFGSFADMFVWWVIQVGEKVENIQQQQK